MSSVSIEDEPIISKSDNFFDLLGAESEKTESKDIFGGFVNATSTNNILFDEFVLKSDSKVSSK